MAPSKHMLQAACRRMTSQRALHPMRNIPGWGVAPSAKYHAFDLGPTNALKDVSQQGWQLATTVRNSEIPAEGFAKSGARSTNGRFATEFGKAGSTVIRKPMMPMAKIDSLLGLPHDLTITFANVEDLEKYIELSVSEGGHSREAVMQCYQHYMYGFNGKTTCLNVSTWTVNHRDDTTDGATVKVTEQTLPGGGMALVGEAMVDINVGDELYMDYGKFVIPEFYTAYTKKHGFQDIQKATLEAAMFHAYGLLGIGVMPGRAGRRPSNWKSVPMCRKQEQGAYARQADWFN